MVRKILPMLLVLLGLSLAACGEYGQVEQGRVVKFDTSTTPATVWIIKDSAIDDRNPLYNVLPAHPFFIPEDPREMGAVPKAGDLVYLNVEEKYVTMFNFEKQQFDRLPFELVSHTTDVSVRRQHPLVWDSANRRARQFPIVNEKERTVTIFFQRQRTVTEIKLSEEDFAKFKPEEWDAGDEIRIYFREGSGGPGKPGRSLRLMNVTRTNVMNR